MASPPAPSTELEPEPTLPTTPQLTFEPPLQFQRQFTIHETTKHLSQTPRFSNKLTRLLDAGCGDATLLRRLIPCDDLLPLSKMTGIDICQSPTWPSLRQNPREEEDRWYGLDINLFLGSFEDLQIHDVGYHDVIVSAEVIEHLDPGPLSAFAPVLLGRMKPRVCIVTTPNRDFNALFDYLEALDPAVEKFEGFRRPEVPYRMRHHDHRFEWTRREFRLWAREAAEKFGYDVEFTGAGGLGRGMMVEGENVDAVLREAAETCGSVDEIPSGSSEWGEMKGIICPVDDNDAGQHPVLRAFGDCSQVAVFVIKPGGEEEVQPRHAEGETLRLVHIHNYSFQKEEFPPSLRAVLEPLMIGGRLLRFVPELIIEEWLKGDEHLKDARYREQHGWPEDGQNWRELDDVSLQLSAKLGGKLSAINTVEVAIDAQRLWEETYALQRACHYRYEVFLDVLNGIKATEAPETIIDIASLKVETQIQQGESIVTATFPAKKKPVHQEQDERVMYVENGYDEFEHDELEPADEEQEYYYSDNEEYQWDIYSEAGSMDDGDVEFNTVIEWVSHSDPELARFALPPRPEGMEGTLCLPLEEKVEGEKLLRVRFFGPTKDIEVRDYDESQGEEENWDGTWLREDEEELEV